jgi:hypothetical protein
VQELITDSKGEMAVFVYCAYSAAVSRIVVLRHRCNLHLLSVAIIGRPAALVVLMDCRWFLVMASVFPLNHRHRHKPYVI